MQEKKDQVRPDGLLDTLSLTDDVESDISGLQEADLTEKQADDGQFERVDFNTSNYDADPELHEALISFEQEINNFLKLAFDRQQDDEESFTNLGSFAHLHQTAQEYISRHRNLAETLNDLVKKLLEAESNERVDQLKKRILGTLERYLSAWENSQNTYSRIPDDFAKERNAATDRIDSLVSIYESINQAKTKTNYLAREKKLSY